jgi:hypothetical protein
MGSLKGPTIMPTPKDPQLDLAESPGRPPSEPPPPLAADQTPLPVVAPLAAPIIQAAPEPQELERYANAAPERAISAFASEQNFISSQRMAKALAASSLMPKEYQGNIPNVLIAMELASRIGVSVLMVAQNLDLIHNRPSWRATFLIATVNQCGRFTPLRFRWVGQEGTPNWGCRAVAKDRASGDECIGSLITMALAKAEGWSEKGGSKWKTLPEQMLMYRAAAFWTRIYSPELSLGMHTTDEVIDTYGEVVRDTPAALAPGNPSSLEAALRARNGAPVES